MHSSRNIKPSIYNKMKKQDKQNKIKSDNKKKARKYFKEIIKDFDNLETVTHGYTKNDGKPGLDNNSILLILKYANDLEYRENFKDDLAIFKKVKGKNLDIQKRISKKLFKYTKDTINYSAHLNNPRYLEKVDKSIYEMPDFKTKSISVRQLNKKEEKKPVNQIEIDKDKDEIIRRSKEEVGDHTFLDPLNYENIFVTKENFLKVKAFLYLANGTMGFDDFFDIDMGIEKEVNQPTKTDKLKYKFSQFTKSIKYINP
ncbi:MAG: hypothetical protein GY730_03900 [bacterium]|nr:hypothetical protein [bacterium]